MISGCIAMWDLKHNNLLETNGFVFVICSSLLDIVQFVGLHGCFCIHVSVDPIFDTMCMCVCYLVFAGSLVHLFVINVKPWRIKVSKPFSYKHAYFWHSNLLFTFITTNQNGLRCFNIGSLRGPCHHWCHRRGDRIQCFGGMWLHWMLSSKN